MIVKSFSGYVTLRAVKVITVQERRVGTESGVGNADVDFSEFGLVLDPFKHRPDLIDILQIALNSKRLLWMQRCWWNIVSCYFRDSQNTCLRLFEIGALLTRPWDGLKSGIIFFSFSNKLQVVGIISESPIPYIRKSIDGWLCAIVYKLIPKTGNRTPILTMRPNYDVIFSFVLMFGIIVFWPPKNILSKN